jgi:hypothetical protein
MELALACSERHQSDDGIGSEYVNSRNVTGLDVPLHTNILLLHAHPLLGNVLVNNFPRRQILDKQSVARLRNNR